MNKFLAIDQYLDVQIEDCEAIIDHAVVNGLSTRYFKIEVDEFGTPTLTEITEVTE